MSPRRLSILLFAILCPALARAATVQDDLQRLIAARDWTRGSAVCRELPETEARRRDVAQLAPAHYAEVAALCAAVASGAGDSLGAEWWWYTAIAMDAKRALELLPTLREQGLLTDLPPPRTAVGAASVEPGKSEPLVTLPSGERVAGTPAKVTGRPRPLAFMGRIAPKSGARTDVELELLIDADGVARAPMLLSAQAWPLHTLHAFTFLREWRFEPAIVAGQPTASVFVLRVGTNRMPS